MTVKTQAILCMVLFILSITLICLTAKPADAATALRAFDANSLEKIGPLVTI